MELSKHKNHRNLKYLAWLRSQPCAVSGDKAQCAHHIRLGTNGGSSLKPSDYFCIPLLNEFHTTGTEALHMIGEETFLNSYKLDKVELFNFYLKAYLKETFDTYIQIEGRTPLELLAFIVELIEDKGPEKKLRTKKKTPAKSTLPKVSITESEFYQKSKELKRERDKELRSKLKIKVPSQKIDTNSEYYLAAKKKASEFRKQQYQKLKELRK
jgi:hypothetical protein